MRNSGGGYDTIRTRGWHRASCWRRGLIDEARRRQSNGVPMVGAAPMVAGGVGGVLQQEAEEEEVRSA
jgi:hypothetical protein